jgi:hypothetical protein
MLRLTLGVMGFLLMLTPVWIDIIFEQPWSLKVRQIVAMTVLTAFTAFLIYVAVALVGERRALSAFGFAVCALYWAVVLLQARSTWSQF